MTEPSLEEIVARWEGLEVEIDALIASWRARGEAIATQNGVIVSGARKLNEAREAVEAMRAKCEAIAVVAVVVAEKTQSIEGHGTALHIADAIAALKDKP